jgi:hypothetical protein
VIGVASGSVPAGRNAADAQEQPAPISLSGVLADGTAVDTQLDKDGRLPDGQTLSDFRRLSRDTEPFDSPGTRPLRLVTLATGERIPVRLHSAISFQIPVERDGESPLLQLSLAGQRVTLPAWAVSAVASPVGCRDVVIGGSPLRDDFWTHREGPLADVVVPSGGTAVVPLSGRLERDIDASVKPLLVEMTVAWPESDGGSLEFLFADSEAGAANGRGAETGIRLSPGEDRILVRRLGSLRVALAASSVRRAEIGPKSKLRLTINRGLTLSLAGRVLARGSRMPGGLKSIVVRSSKANRPAGRNAASSKQRQITLEEARAPVVLSCLVRTRTAAASGTGGPVSDDHVAVQLQDGDLFYGKAVRVGDRDVHLPTRFGPVDFGWAEVSRVALPRAIPREVPSVFGTVCRVQLAADSAMTFFGPQPTFELTGAVRLTGTSVEIQHPLLVSVAGADETASPSRIALPWASVQKIEPLFRGEYRLLDPGPRHVGNVIQRSFSRPKPDGTSLTLHFVLTEIPAGKVFLSLEAAELEPASPQTLRATPKLAELRRGFLTTNVLLNDVDAGSLNRHCEFLSPIGTPKRLRIPLPREALKRGLNILKLQQTPSRMNPEKFDECELRRVAIEIESRGAQQR